MQATQITKKQEKQNERDEALTKLREILKPGDTLFTTLEHVSRSGMMRHISVYKLLDGDRICLNWYFDKLNIAKRGKSYDSKNADSLRVAGCGMDMGYHLVYSLSSAVFKDFKCIGEGCPSNDHTNDRKPYKFEKDGKNIKGKAHSDGGYALNHRWL